MKKAIMIILALVLVLVYATGCGNVSEGAAGDTDARVSGAAFDSESAKVVEILAVPEVTINTDIEIEETHALDASDSGESFRGGYWEVQDWTAASKS